MMEEQGEDVTTRTLGAGGLMVLDTMEGIGEIGKRGITKLNIAKFLLDKDYREDTINFYQTAGEAGSKAIKEPFQTGYQVTRFSETNPERFGLELTAAIALEGAGAGFRGTRLADEMARFSPTKVGFAEELTTASQFPSLKNTVLKGGEVSDNLLQTATKQRQTVLAPFGKDPASIRATPPMEDFFDPLKLAGRHKEQRRIYDFGFERPLSIAQEEAISTVSKTTGKEVQTFISEPKVLPENTVITSRGFVGKKAQRSGLLFPDFQNLGGNWDIGRWLPPADKWDDIGRGLGEAGEGVLRAGFNYESGLGRSIIPLSNTGSRSEREQQSVVINRKENVFPTTSNGFEELITPVYETGKDYFSRPKSETRITPFSTRKPDETITNNAITPKIFSRTKPLSDDFEKLISLPKRTPRKKRTPKTGLSLPKMDFGGENDRANKAFDVQIRRGGKFFTVGTGLTMTEALTYGKKRTSTSLAASFRLIPKGTTKKQDSGFVDLKDFYKKDGLTFIEKRSKRIKSKQEKSEIKLAKKNKGVLKNFLKF